MTLTYAWLYGAVRERFESDAALEAFLPKALTAEELQQKGNDRYLSAMTQRVFQAGIKHAVADAKWPAFEEAFNRFALEEMLHLSSENIQAHLANKQIIRHRAKLETIPKNAQFIIDIEKEYQCSFGEFIANWPISNIIGLWDLLGKRGARLGGRSAPGFLRLAGKDTFFLTSDVVARLVAAGIIEKTPTTKRDLQIVQNTFNDLQRDSGRQLCQLSAMLALSINPKF